MTPTLYTHPYPQVRSLLSDFVPLDSVSVGYAVLAQRRNAVTDVVNNINLAVRARPYPANTLTSDECTRVEHLERGADMEEKEWDAQVCIICIIYRLH
jgi:hypothetical protein